MPSVTKRRPTIADFKLATVAVPAVDDRIVHQVPVADIRPSPHNLRRRVEGIDELAARLVEHQLLQPVVVRRRGRDGYELIAGHRRLEAVKQLGWTTIPAVVRDETTAKVYIVTLVENLQREDLTPREEAEALQVLMRERGWSTRQVGEAIKRSPMYVSRRLRVSEDEVLSDYVLAGQIALSTAEELLRAPDSRTRQDLAGTAAAASWTPADARQAFAECQRNDSLQRGEPLPCLASRIRALRDELAGLDLAALPARTRRELVRLVELVTA